MLRTRALALPLLLVLTLAGCGSPPLPRALGSPSVFASADEALAAAIAAYDRALVVSDAVGQAGGEGAERFRDVAVGQYLEGSIAGFGSWADDGFSQIGFSRFRDVQLMRLKAGPRGAVVVELCHDVTQVDVVDKDGRSIVPPDRDDTLHLEVVFDMQQSRLFVARASRLDGLPC